MATIDSLASVSSTGFNAAQFPEIKNALATAMRDIYGSDIDISSASADGQFVMNEALIINNIYRALEQIYLNFNPDSASGKYLDILASYTNAKRVQASFSTVDVHVKNTNQVSVTPKYILAEDKYGNFWQWTNPIDFLGNKKISIGAGDVVSLDFECMTIGPVTAFGGQSAPDATTWTTAPLNRGCDIYKVSTSDVQGLDVYQQYDAVLGNQTETDASLRSRRVTSRGLRSLTVAESLTGGLYNIKGVKNTFVYNNNTPSAVQMKDNVSVPSHNIYVCIRKDSNVNIPDYRIATTIYDALTPGVLTTASTGGVTVAKQYSIPVINNLSTTIYWKQCTKIQPDFAFAFAPNTGVVGISALTTTQKDAIIQAVRTALDSFSISDTAHSSTVFSAFSGSLSVSPVTGTKMWSPSYVIWPDGKSVNDYIMPLAYFDYANVLFGASHLGYYYNNNFYEDSGHTTLIAKVEGHIYYEMGTTAPADGRYYYCTGSTYYNQNVGPAPAMVFTNKTLPTD